MEFVSMAFLQLSINSLQPDLDVGAGVSTETSVCLGAAGSNVSIELL